MKILCLNKSYIPIRVCTKYSAIGKMFCEMAEPIIVENGQYISFTFDEWMERSIKDVWPANYEFINSVKQRVAIPHIIRYVKYDKIPKVILHLSRRAVYERDNHTCYICGNVFGDSRLTWDHVIPISRGGKTTWENLVTCCQQCNWDKGNQLLSELKIKPKFMPHKPVLSNMQKLKASITHHYDEWSHFGV